MTKQTQYQRGRRKEYELVAELRKSWPIVFRSAGSHSPFDVIAIDPNGKKIELYQVKYYLDWPTSIPMTQTATYKLSTVLRAYKKGNGFREWRG